METWKPIPGLDGYYEASNLGRIRRSKPGVNTKVGRIVKLQSNPNGYIQAATCIAGVEKRHWVHILVAAAFIGDCPDGKEVNHKDGNPANNRSCNLEYVTHQENIDDKERRKQARLVEDVRRWRRGADTAMVSASIKLSAEIETSNDIQVFIAGSEEYDDTADMLEDLVDFVNVNLGRDFVVYDTGEESE